MSVSEDDLSYDELTYDEAPGPTRQVLAGLVVLLIAVLGVPQLWEAVRTGHFGTELLFWPVLGIVFFSLARKGPAR